MPDLLDCLGKKPWYETVLFSNTVRNVLKYFSQHRPIETETWLLVSLPVMEFLCAWPEWVPKYLSVSLLQLDSLPCHKMPHTFLCWDCTAICLTRGLLDTTWVPQAIPQLELAIYYLALSIISRRCFSKWINAEHWANELRMAHKLHESGLILGWSSRSKFRNCES